MRNSIRCSGWHCKPTTPAACAASAVHFFDRLEKFLAVAGVNEHRDFVEFGADAIVTKIERIVPALARTNGDVHPLHWFVTGVVDPVSVTHAAWNGGWPRNQRGAAIDRELRLSVEDEKHLFHVAVYVMADTAFRLNLAAMDKQELRAKRRARQQRSKPDLTRALMNIR